MLLFYNFLDLIGDGFLNAVFQGNGIMLALFIIAVFAFMLFYFGTSMAAVAVVSFGLIISLSWRGGLLPEWVGFLVILIVSVFLMLAALRLFARR